MLYAAKTAVFLLSVFPLQLMPIEWPEVVGKITLCDMIWFVLPAKVWILCWSLRALLVRCAAKCRVITRYTLIVQLSLWRSSNVYEPFSAIM
jgi:hypothetical protein